MNSLLELVTTMKLETLPDEVKEAHMSHKPVTLPGICGVSGEYYVTDVELVQEMTGDYFSLTFIVTVVKKLCE